MSDADSTLWSRWLAANGLDGTTFSYDVQVGTAAAEPPAADGPTRRLYRALFAKRIDALQDASEPHRIYEIKPFADLRVIGQLLVYRDLYVKKVQPKFTPELHLITYRVDPDILPTLDTLGVKVHILPAL